MFFTALGAAMLSDVVGVYFAFCAVYGGSGCLEAEGVNASASIAIPILGTATGAKLAGARFGPALAGSALGFGAALLPFAIGAFVDPNDNFLLFIAIPASIQAAITTLIVSALD